MDALFENKYIRDKSMVNELANYMYFKRPVILIATVLYAVCFIINLVSMLAGYEYSIYGIILPPVFFAFWMYSYFVYKKTMLKRDAETHKGKVRITMCVYEDHISAIGSDGSEIELVYDKVKKTVSTKNYIILLSGAKLMYIFKKDGFTKGTEEDFIKFIKNKGIKIKP